MRERAQPLQMQGGGVWRINLCSYGVVMGGFLAGFLVSEIFWDARLRDHKIPSVSSEVAPAPQQTPCIEPSSVQGLHLSSVATGRIPTSLLDQHHSGHGWISLHLSCGVSFSIAFSPPLVLDTFPLMRKVRGAECKGTQPQSASNHSLTTDP